MLREARVALMNAPFEPDGWGRAISAIAHATGSETAHLAGIGGPMLLPLNLIVGPNADRVGAYAARQEMWGPINWRLRCVGRPMSIQHEPDYEQARALGGTSDYDDAVADIDAPFGCQAALINDESNFVGLALLRGSREGRCDDVVLKRFGYLVRLLQRAVRVQLALDGEAAALMLGGMTTAECRLMLLDRHGCLSALTPAAESLLEEGVAKLAGLSLRLRDEAEDRQLHQAMARLLGDTDDPRTPQVHEMRIARSPEHPGGRWRLSIVRLLDRPDGLGFNARLALNFRPVQQPAHASGDWTSSLRA